MNFEFCNDLFVAFSCWLKKLLPYPSSCASPSTLWPKTRPYKRMLTAEDKLWELRQVGRKLQRYVEDFLKIVHQLSWPDAALGACFLLGLDSDTIRCELTVSDFPLIALIHLILYLNGYNFEVEELKEGFQSCCPDPSEARHVPPAHPMLRTPTYRAHGPNRLPSPNHPHTLLSSTIVLSPEPLSVAQSSPLFTGSRRRHPWLPKPAVHGRLSPPLT